MVAGTGWTAGSEGLAAARRAVLAGDGSAAEALLAAGGCRAYPAGRGLIRAGEVEAYLILAGGCRLAGRWGAAAALAAAALAALGVREEGDPRTGSGAAGEPRDGSGAGERVPTGLLAWAHFERGAALTHLGDVRLGRRHLLAFLAGSRAWPEGQALRPLAWTYLGRGLLAQRRLRWAACALAAAARAWECGGAAGSGGGAPPLDRAAAPLAGAAAAWCEAAWAAALAGCLDRSQRWLVRVDPWLRATPPAAAALVAHAQVLRQQGQLAQALAACRQVLAGQAAGAGPQELAMAGWLAAQILLAQGATGEAALTARAACAHALAAGYPLLLSGVQAVLARAQAVLARTQAARNRAAARQPGTAHWPAASPRPRRGRRAGHG